MGETPTAGTQDSPEIDPDDVEVVDPVDRIGADAFLQLVAPESRARLLRAFMTLGVETADNPTGLMEKADISHETFYRHLAVLLSVDEADREAAVHFGIVEKAGNHGNSPLYQLKADDPIVQALIEVRERAFGRLAE